MDENLYTGIGGLIKYKESKYCDQKIRENVGVSSQKSKYHSGCDR